MKLSFFLILQHRETDEIRYHYVSDKIELPNSPILIRNQHDLDNLLDFLASQDFPSQLNNQHPDSKWVTECIVSLCIHLVMTTYPLGKPPHPPNYVSRTIATSFNWRKMKVLQELTRTVYPSFVFLLLECSNILVTIVTEKPNNSFTATVTIFKSIVNI